MKRLLTSKAKEQLDSLMSEFELAPILYHMASATYEAADSVGHNSEGGKMLIQQAVSIDCAALFCARFIK